MCNIEKREVVESPNQEVLKKQLYVKHYGLVDMMVLGQRLSLILEVFPALMILLSNPLMEFKQWPVAVNSDIPYTQAVPIRNWLRLDVPVKLSVTNKSNLPLCFSFFSKL